MRDLSTEQFEDPCDLSLRAQWKGKGTAQPRFQGGWDPRKIIVLGDVPNPGRLLGRDHATRQPDGVCEGSGERDPFKFFQLRSAGVPRRSAAQRCVIVFAEPDGPGDPIPAGGNGLNDCWADLAERGGSGQQAGHGILGGAAFFVSHSLGDIPADFRCADHNSRLVPDG